MNTFRTVGHLLRTDLRRFWPYLVMWLLVNASAVVVERAVLTEKLARGAFDLLRAAQMFGFILLTVQVFLADSAAHSRSQWWTRPIGAWALLGAKLLYVVVGLWMPVAVVYLLGWYDDGFTARQMLLATAELALYAGGAAALFGGVAAVSTNFGLMFAGIALIGLAAGVGVRLRFILGRICPDWWRVGEAVQPLVLLAGFMAAGVLCWLSVYGFRRRRAAFAALAVAGLSPIWLPSAARWDPTEVPFETPLSLQSPADDFSREAALFRNLSVVGLPEAHYVLPLSADFTFSSQDSKQMLVLLDAHPAFLLNSAVNDIDHVRYAWPVLVEALPPEVLYFSSIERNYDSIEFRLQVAGENAMDTSDPGVLKGETEFVIFELVSAGMLPLREGARVTHEGHGFQIIDVDIKGQEAVAAKVRLTQTVVEVFKPA